MTEDTEPVRPAADPYSLRGAPLAFGALLFAFGLAAGFILAFSGYAVFSDSASFVVTLFLAALFVVALVGVLVFLLRGPLMQRLFGLASAQLELFAAPLAKVAERAIERDPHGATDAARDLVRLALARYAWLSTRRWIVASLTALIAAMAALAGTALLFKQNELLAVQSELLAQQNARIADQTVLLNQDVELAEAQRNAALAVEITQIAGALGAVAEAVHGRTGPQTANALDPETDLDRALVLRITSISRALKPYRFLEPGVRPGDPADRFRVAMQRRRADLPQTYARMAAYYGWAEPDGQTRLIDRPASPERGQLLNVLVTGGVRNLETFNLAGLDLSHAHLPAIDLGVFSAQLARLAFADFSGAYLTDADFGGASLENARFARASLRRCDFSVLEAGRVRPPIRAEDAPFRTFASGADFSGAYLEDISFAGAWLLAANFDGALAVGASFAGAELGTATLRGAVLARADFAGAGLKSTDFDGAILFGGDPVAALAAAAAPGSFVADRWAADPVALDEVMAIALVFNNVERATLEAAGAPWRLRRVKPFEEAPEPVQ